MSEPTLKFLGWDRPAIDLAVSGLLAWNEEDPDAFRRALLIVPTSESGRRLRECLAERVKRPLLTPRLTLMGNLIPCEGGAGRLETTAAWLHVLRLSDGFRGKPLAWILGIAKQMMNVRRVLEQELRSPDVGREWHGFIRSEYPGDEDTWRAAADNEHERWEVLRTLFSEVDKRLEAWHLQPAEKARAQELESPMWPTGCSRIAVLFVPEISPQNRLYLRHLQKLRPGGVEIWVNAPYSERLSFDSFGQPLQEAWGERPIGIPRARQDGEGGSVLHMASNARMLGLKARELASGLASDDVVLASCDREFSPSLVTAFAPEWSLNLPEGRSFLATEAGRIPLLLAAACRRDIDLPGYAEDSGEVEHASSRPVLAFAELLRHAALQRCYGKTLNLIGFNRHLDEILQLFLPARTHRLLETMDPSTMMVVDESEFNKKRLLNERREDFFVWAVKIDQLVRGCMSQRTFPASLRELSVAMEEEYGHVTGPLSSAVQNLCKRMLDVAALVENPAMECTPEMALELLVDVIEAESAGALEEMAKEATAMDVQGWRELVFARGRRVILTGMHEGCVPEFLPPDSYLPDAFRQFAEMSGNASRVARDAFLLTALLHSRPAGEVHFVLVRQKADGTPIIPSSLLLRCEDLKELAERARMLYADIKDVVEAEPYDCLRLIEAGQGFAKPGEMESVALIAPGSDNPFSRSERKFSPSLIKSFLACPLRFWLRELHELDPGNAYEEDKAELGAAEYGTLLHAVLKDVAERFPSVSRGRTCEKLAEEISDFSIKRAQELFQSQYAGAGAELSFPLALQLESMKKSLSVFAGLHAADLAAGWEVKELEASLPLELPAGGGRDPILFNMRADRIDKKEDGSWRIIDYKTNAVAPAAVHLEKLAEGKDSAFCRLMPDFPVLEVVRKDKSEFYRWINVQLPLYAEALMKKCRLEDMPELAYYLFPRTKPLEVTYQPFLRPDKKSLTDSDHAGALDCVRAAVRLMRQGLCLYSAETLQVRLPSSRFGALSPEADPRTMCGLPLVDIT